MLNEAAPEAPAPPVVPLPAMAAMDMANQLRTVGTTLVSTVGGASGPLYGTAFLRAGAAAVFGDAQACTPWTYQSSFSSSSSDRVLPAATFSVPFWSLIGPAKAS